MVQDPFNTLIVCCERDMIHVSLTLTAKDKDCLLESAGVRCVTFIEHLFGSIQEGEEVTIKARNVDNSVVKM